MLTWKQLKEHIETMDKEQLNTNVTIHLTDDDEFIAADDIDYTNKRGNGVLDPFHPYLVVKY